MTETTGRKQPRGRYKPGETGNAAGRPRGARNKATVAAEVLLDGQAGALTRRAIDLAISGDVAALRLCLERILPPRRDRPISFKLGQIERPADTVRALGEILGAVGAGDVTPQEGASVAALIQLFVQALEATELERRIGELEARNERA